MKEYLIGNEILVKTNKKIWFLPEKLEVNNYETKRDNIIIFKETEKIKPKNKGDKIIGDYSWGGNKKLYFNKFGSKILLKNILGNCKILFNQKASKEIKIEEILKNILKIKLLQNNLIMLHGSSVSKNRDSLIFLGWSGSGKTPLLVKLLEEFDLKYISDEITIVSGKNYVFSNPREFREELPKKLNIPRSIVPFLSKIPGAKSLRKKVIGNYNIKSYESEKKKIKYCLLIQPSRKKKVKKIKKEETLKKIINLLEEDMKINQNIFIKKYFYLNNIDFSKLFKKQIKILKEFIKGTTFLEVRGDLKDIFNETSKLVGEIK